MNRKAFTLIELIAVITILGILASVGVILLTSLMNNFKNEYYDKTIKSIETAAREYVADHKSLSYDEQNTTVFSIQDLINNSYISDVKVYNKKEENCTGNITYKRNNNKFEICLTCNKKNYGTCN